MNVRPGQVVLYLAFVLVAIAFLVLMNIGVYLGVSARNSTMNSGDAAALAVAHYQGELLNRIGAWNLDHLKAALDDDAEKCAEITMRQLRASFLDPLEGIVIGNAAAKENGCDQCGKMKQILADHARDVRLYYAPNPDVYPEPWKGAWEEYAQHLEVAIANGIWAGPDNIDFIDAATGHYLLNQGFYQAIASRNWCWFHFNAPGLISSYTSFQDWAPLPGRDAETRRRKCVNSEVYSLNLDLRVGSAVNLLGTNLIARLTGASFEEISRSSLIRDEKQGWFFYDTSEPWREWWEIDPAGEWSFPSIGPVKSEYNVRGCAAVCRTSRVFSTVVDDAVERSSVWSGAAKPFGTVENERGRTDVVTALKGLVTPCFVETKLVPLDTVGGCDLSTADPEWMEHVRHHLDSYLEHGPNSFSSCWYCRQLATWEGRNFRAAGAKWIKYNSNTCIRPHGPGGGHGGSAHGH